jgi:hypothetical protein
VLDDDGDAWQKKGDRWRSHAIDGHASSKILQHNPLTLLHHVPEPDHSMCARLVPQDSETHPWVFKHRNGKAFYGITEHEAREGGYAIPEQGPTVVERAAEVLNHVDLRGNDLGTVFAEALDRAGLLVRDGEQ